MYAASLFSFSTPLLKLHTKGRRTKAPGVPSPGRDFLSQQPKNSPGSGLPGDLAWFFLFGKYFLQAGKARQTVLFFELRLALDEGQGVLGKVVGDVIALGDERLYFSR